jgi:hypothetical protein
LRIAWDQQSIETNLPAFFAPRAVQSERPEGITPGKEKEKKGNGQEKTEHF